MSQFKMKIENVHAETFKGFPFVVVKHTYPSCIVEAMGSEAYFCGYVGLFNDQEHVLNAPGGITWKENRLPRVETDNENRLWHGFDTAHIGLESMTLAEVIIECRKMIDDVIEANS